MIRVAIILGSTRPGRIGEGVAKWVYDLASRRTDAHYEFVDLKDFNLPLLDEPGIPAMGHYIHEHTKRWSEKISSFDAFVFVTAEYNHSVPAALKNALDCLYTEWNYKAAGFIGYGNTNGARAIEHLRSIMGELKVVDARTQTGFSIFTDFENFRDFKPTPRHDKSVQKVLDNVVSLGTLMQGYREQMQRQEQQAG